MTIIGLLAVLLGGAAVSGRGMGIGEAIAMLLTFIVCGALILLLAAGAMYAARELAILAGDRSLLPMMLAAVVAATMLAPPAYCWARDRLRGAI